MGTWFGVLAPAATPADVVGRLNAEMVKIIRSPDFSRRMAEIGAVPIGDTPAEMKARIGTDTENYAKLVKDAKVAIN
jgi:tripartite-type tricarboxylate transporter receptor subunit TctC